MKRARPEIIIIDENRNWAAFVRTLAAPVGVVHTATLEGARRLLTSEEISLVLVSSSLPDAPVAEVLKALSSRIPALSVLVVGASIDRWIAVSIGTLSAWGFLHRELPAEVIQTLLMRARDDALAWRETLGEGADRALRIPRGFIVKSSALARVVSYVSTSARRGLPLLLEGPRGSGKRTLAQLYHRYSHRAPERFVEFSAPTALTAPQGPAATRTALLEAAREAGGGTLFIREVGALSLELQEELAQWLGESIPTASAESRAPALVASSSQNLTKAMDLGTFNGDLLALLSVFPVEVPSLADRVQEIPALTQYYTAFFSRERRLPPKFCTQEFLAALVRHQWEENVSGLRAAIAHAVDAAGDQRELFAHHLSGFPGFSVRETVRPTSLAAQKAFDAWLDHMPRLGQGFSLDDHLDREARKIVTYALAVTGSNLTKTADLLGISRRRLTLLAKKLGIRITAARGRPKE